MPIENLRTGAAERLWSILLSTAFFLGIVSSPGSAMAQSGERPFRDVAGDPVDTVDGDFLYKNVDFSLPGPGPYPVFERTYDTFNSRPGPLGPGWSHTYNPYLTDPGDAAHPNDVVLVEPDTRSDRFVFLADDPDRSRRYSPPQAVHTTLVRNPDQSFTAETQNQGVWTFDSSGRLTRILGKDQMVANLTYAANGQLIAVSDPSNRGSLALAYNSCFAGRLCSVTDWTGRSVSFGYDADGRLASTTDREGQATHYTYDGSSIRMATMTDPLGHLVVGLTYDSQERVVSQSDARGEHVALAYGSGAAGQVTTMTYAASGLRPDWHPILVDNMDELGRLNHRVTQAAPEDEPYVEAQGYDADWNVNSCSSSGGGTPRPPGDEVPLPTRAPPTATQGDAAQPVKCTGPAYGPVDWYADLDPRAVLLRAMAAAQQGATDVSYDTVGRVRRFVAAGQAEATARTWSIQYDREDRPRSISLPGLAGKQPLAWEIRYDAAGRAVAIVQPGGQLDTFTYEDRGLLVGATLASGQTTSYSYDDRGDLTRMDRVPADGSGETVVDYAFDGLRRLRQITSYPAWPDTEQTLVTAYAYDNEGHVSAYGSAPPKPMPSV